MRRLVFDGLRFVRARPDVLGADDASNRPEPMRGTKFTDECKDFPIWGLGTRVW